MFLLLGLGDGKIASAAQIGGNFIGEHFFQTEAEQVGRVPAIGPCHDVAASTRGSARTAVTRCPTVAETSANGDVRIDVANPVAFVRPLPLRVGKLALEDLAPPSNGAERIAVNDVDRRTGRKHISPPRPDLVSQRLVDPRLGGVWSLRVVDQLSLQRRDADHKSKNGASSDSYIDSHRSSSLSIFSSGLVAISRESHSRLKTQ